MISTFSNWCSKRVLWFLSAFIILLTIGFSFRIKLVEVGDQQLFFEVKDGDILSHEFTHSIYNVPVIEHIRIDQKSLHLFHVTSPSDAALEYYMIEGKHEFNVNSKIEEFYIPTASIGEHRLRINDQVVLNSIFRAQEGSVRIRLTRLSLISYGAHLLLKKITGANHG